MRRTVPGLLFGLVLAGCTGEVDDERLAPAYPEGSGQAPQGKVQYPEGPYGSGKGATIANYKFVGFVNAVADSSQLQEIRLADFYNPTGDGVYEEDSPFEPGSPRPRGLLLSVSAVWCAPCNYEADVILPEEYPKYKALGGEFFVQLADGATPGKAANAKALEAWTKKYEVDYPMAIDPAYQLGALFEADSFPANMIIDTRTMRIVDVVAGSPEVGGPFWKTFDEVLASGD